jgi:hypothetical protein
LIVPKRGFVLSISAQQDLSRPGSGPVFPELVCGTDLHLSNPTAVIADWRLGSAVQRATQSDEIFGNKKGTNMFRMEDVQFAPVLEYNDHPKHAEGNKANANKQQKGKIRDMTYRNFTSFPQTLPILKRNTRGRDATAPTTIAPPMHVHGCLDGAFKMGTEVCSKQYKEVVLLLLKSLSSTRSA